MKKLLFIVLTIFLQSCNGNLMSGFNNSQFSNASNEKIDDYSTPTNQLNKTRELLDGASINFPTLTATGYAVVSTQPGQNVEQKRLMAIRAARMAAMRELAEQIHGLKIDSSTTVIDLVTQNDTFRTMVQGTIRGAKTVRINPTGDDTYETVLEIDREIMLLLLREARSIKA